MQKSFTLYKSLIYETVKNETHISAHVARASDKNAAELAYHEEIGDEAFHARKLERSLFASLDKIKAEIIGYLDTNASTVNINTTVAEDAITFTVILSDRFNAAYLTPLADLVSKFVEDNMLFLWWTPINANNAKIYADHVELDRQAVLKCFIKNAPAASDKNYGNVTGGGTSGSGYCTAITSGATHAVGVGDVVNHTYTLTPSNAIDDIVVSSSDNSKAVATKLSNGVVAIKGVAAGSATVTIASLNNLALSQSVSVTVS